MLLKLTYQVPSPLRSLRARRDTSSARKGAEIAEADSKSLHLQSAFPLHY
jgi:hypothetical protein